MHPYDAHADWYAGYVTGDAADHTRRVGAALARMLGTGQGICVDVGCGTGVHTPVIRRMGWTVIGLDASLGQLRHTAQMEPVAAADASRLPLRPRCADAVVATLIHTDVAAWDPVVHEIGRVLKPGAPFAYVGVHPCFVGPFAERRPGGLIMVHPGYRDTTLTYRGPGIGTGIRPRVGVRHRSLADVLTAVLDAGLDLRAIAEFPEDGTPDLIAFRATRRGGDASTAAA